VWALAQARDVPIDVFMETVLAFRGDATRVVVEAEATYLDALADRLVREADRPLLGRVADALARPLWDRLGWDPRPGETTEPR
jgi:hypothetical protein